MDRNATAKKPRIRFSPDPGTLAEIRFEQQGIAVFGLVLNNIAFKPAHSYGAKQPA
jgi:hypothetical protein